MTTNLVDLHISEALKLLDKKEISSVELTKAHLEEMEKARIQRRLEEAKVELERSKQYDYVVINDDLERAIAEVESITRRELEE